MRKKAVLAVAIVLAATSLFLYIDINGSGLSSYEEIKHGANPIEKDTDNDGLTDYEEIRIYNTDPSDKYTIDNNLTDYEESKIYNTDPLKEDTLGNGLTDYKEIKVYNTNPLEFDTDKDGLTDYEEIKEYQSDPLSNDTDSDGLKDSKEIDIYGTDPSSSDTDNDGLTDYEEVNTHNTNPKEKDSDKDGLTDYEEVKEYGTNPLKNDTNGDGLTDYEEVKEYGTNPLKNDTNGDGLTDYEEVKEYGTNPLKNDTNGDGLTDYKNVQNNLDPLSLDTSGDRFTDFYSVNSPYIDGSRKSIMIELRYMEGVNIPRNRLDKIEKEFANSPKNSFDLNFVINETPVDAKPEVSVKEYYQDYYTDPNVYSKAGEGYYNLLLVPSIDDSQIESAGGIRGATTLNSDGMMVEEIDDPDAYASTIAHEIGHQLGLNKDLYPGIDSREYSVNAYPSTLNYNWVRCTVNGGCGQDHKYTYSSGNGFDDWKYISEEFINFQPSMRELSCDREVVC